MHIFKNTGFTLIELIVTIGVLGILVGLSYAGYATFTQRQKLITAGQNLKNILRDVESRSFNNEVDCSICNCTDPFNLTLDGWYADLSNKQFYGVCRGIIFTQTPFEMSDEIIISSNFSAMEFSNNPPSVNEDVNICLSLAGLPDRYYRIEINKAGEINDSGGLILTCTP